MIHGTRTPEAQALDEALPPSWHVEAVDYNDNPGASGYPHPPGEYEYGRSPCYVTVVRTGRKPTYSSSEGYGHSDEPQWWVHRHCPADRGVPRHDLDATVGAHDGRQAAELAAELAGGATSEDARDTRRRWNSDFRHGDDFGFSGWR